ncbi:MAG: Methyltransferase type 12 [Candidatus Woesebacteria bacterium GW2011_GWB1_45_5]|uniref:Methyltransferase type 12 n=1 Tax=Candidatus Woesebacteria bacterium GW2011_GWB1_45_5 TaxID=1618581 RepID=A0A0G1QQK5_9BACT|nr:MAG: Methyltransferase type 12 [Candidatus Woesebacteria bacterium GW2011_GWB1_45_5]
MKCFVCNGESWLPFYKNLVFCEGCGFVKAADRFFKINPEKVYDKKYYTKGQYADYEKEKASLAGNFSDRLAQIIKYKKGGKILDVGCAYGYFLLEAKRFFEIRGIDLDKNTTRKASLITGADITTGNFLKHDFKREKFDVITFFDSIEHLTDPKKAILKSARMLKNGGIVAIETGDVESVLSKIEKEKWRLIDPGVHLNYFSRKTLNSLLVSCGFKVLAFSYVSFRRSIRQVMHRLLGKNLFIPFLSGLPLKVNTFDIMFVIAKKI